MHLDLLVLDNFADKFFLFNLNVSKVYLKLAQILPEIFNWRKK